MSRSATSKNPLFFVKFVPAAQANLRDLSIVVFIEPAYGLRGRCPAYGTIREF
jgi:hypothetical protein